MLWVKAVVTSHIWYSRRAVHIKLQIQVSIAWLYQELNMQMLGLNCLYPWVNSQLVH